MKLRNLTNLLLLAAALVAVACKEDKPEVKAPVFKVEETTVSVPATSTSASISYTIENPVSGEVVKAASDAEWLSSFSEGTNGKVSFNVELNYGDERSAVVTLTYATTDPVDVTVTQMSAEENIDITPKTLAFTNVGGTLSVKVDGSRQWTVSGDADWVTPSFTSGYPGTEVAFTATANPTISERTAEFEFSNGKNTVKLSVSQAATPITDLFTDANFKKYVLDNFDTDKNGKISEEEAAAVTAINYTESGNGEVTSFAGVEAFSNLTEFVFEAPTYGGTMSTVDTIDLSSNKKLTNVEVTDRELKGLILTGLDKVTNLRVALDTALHTLDISSLTSLKEMFAYNSGLEALDCSKNVELENLSVAGTKIKDLDFSKNLKLVTLRAGTDSLETIDISKNTGVTSLSLDGSKKLKTKPSFSHMTKLTSLSFQYYPFESFAEPELVNLVELTLDYSTKLKHIDVSKNMKLNSLSLFQLNYLETITFTTGQYIPSMSTDYINNPKGHYNYNESEIKVIFVDGESYDDVASYITDAAFKKAMLAIADTDSDGKISDAERKAVTEISVPSKGIKSLAGLEYFPSITKLDVSGNDVTSVDFTNAQSLTELNVSNTKVASLNFTRVKGLQVLNAASASLTAVSGLTSAIKTVDLSNNSLTGLDLGYCTNLIRLDLSNNKIKTLDIHGDSSLEYLDISNNVMADQGYESAVRFWSLSALKTLKASKFGYTDSIYSSQELKNLKLVTVDLSGNDYETLNLTGSAATLTSLDVSNSPKLKSVYIGEGATIEDSAIKKDSGTTIYRTAFSTSSKK